MENGLKYWYKKKGLVNVYMKYVRNNKRRARKSSRKYAPRSLVKKAVRKVRASVFRKKVLAVVHSQNESKMAFTSVTSQAINCPIDSSTEIAQLIPNITQGVSDYQRIGDQITLQSMTVKGYIRLPSTLIGNATYNRRMAIRMMIVKPKRYQSYDDIKANVSNWTSSLLKKGGTTTSFTGVISDIWAPINSDAITKYYDKTFYLRQDQIWYGGAAITNGIPFSVTSEGTIKFFTVVKKFGKGKKLTYDPSIDTGVLPSNFAPVLIAGLVYLDGTAPSATTEAYVSYDVTFNYEDA